MVANTCSGTVSVRTSTAYRVGDGSQVRFEEKGSRLRGEHDLAYGHAKAIIHEYDLRRAARKLLRPRPSTTERPAGAACGPFRRRAYGGQSFPLMMESRRSISR